jgi:hypothetical protein
MTDFDSVWEDLFYFAMDIHLTTEERSRLHPLLQPLLLATLLVNDYYSWPKEAKVHLEREDSRPLYNSVLILMQEYGCSESRALEMLDVKIQELQQTHLTLLKDFELEMKSIPRSYYKIISGAQYTLSGTNFWSSYTTRYPTKVELKQLECIFVDGKLRYKYSNPPNGQSGEHNEENCQTEVQPQVVRGSITDDRDSEHNDPETSQIQQWPLPPEPSVTHLLKNDDAEPKTADPNGTRESGNRLQPQNMQDPTQSNGAQGDVAFKKPSHHVSIESPAK